MNIRYISRVIEVCIVVLLIVQLGSYSFIARQSSLEGNAYGSSSFRNDEHYHKSDSESLRGQGTRQCYRQCPHYDNLIIFEGKWFAGRGSGLNDRIYIITAAANFAAYLCARLVVPSPHRMLGRKHNYGKRVDKSLTWKDDFTDVVLLADGTSAIIQADNTTDIEAKYREAKADILYARREKDVKNTFHKVRQRVIDHKRTPFMWTIDRNYWEGFDQFILPEIRKLSNTTERDILPIPGTMPEGDCAAVKRIPSSFVQSAIDQTSSRIGDRAYGSLHLRRGDAANTCDTSVDKVRDYLACSMNGTLAPNNYTLLLSTDESSAEYIQSIKSIVESFGFRFEHLDEIVSSIIQEQLLEGKITPQKVNNHLVYMIVSTIAYEANFYLERRREMACYDCAPWLVEKLKDMTASDVGT